MFTPVKKGYVDGDLGKGVVRECPIGVVPVARRIVNLSWKNWMQIDSQAATYHVNCEMQIDAKGNCMHNSNLKFITTASATP